MAPRKVTSLEATRSKGGHRAGSFRRRLTRGWRVGVGSLLSASKEPSSRAGKREKTKANVPAATNQSSCTEAEQAGEPRRGTGAELRAAAGRGSGRNKAPKIPGLPIGAQRPRAPGPPGAEGCRCVQGVRTQRVLPPQPSGRLPPISPSLSVSHPSGDRR